ncbi:hypothetical protein [Sphingomonas sp. Leaf38]|uniref:hypothetical protein n=1 Tax=Sphingomonas sp. Leaf38 TaxID=1736217 RepID=UPI0006F28AA1|nr:hypothetical protein [Sphingomonas sp. Leaf38]KQN33593.1 hypothetical protein ASE88_00745 [Sphingomonas sp. Leaf38]
MADSAILRSNERAKAISNALFNLGAALVGACAVKLYAKPTIDLELTIWSLGAGMLIYVGWLWLSLLESEA